MKTLEQYNAKASLSEKIAELQVQLCFWQDEAYYISAANKKLENKLYEYNNNYKIAADFEPKYGCRTL